MKQDFNVLFWGVPVVVHVAVRGFVGRLCIGYFGAGAGVGFLGCIPVPVPRTRKL